MSKSISDINKTVREAIASLDMSGYPAELYDPISYIVSVGGKRIRPTLCLLSYSLFRESISEYEINPAIALEIFHAFTLIHDDIMDKADTRRGHPTIHKKWNENIAILSGDVMSIKAYEFLSRARKEKIPQLLSLFNKTAIQVCEGQQYDMNFEDEESISMNDYLYMIGLKTAALIACSSMMGGLLAGVEDKVAKSLYDYGWQLGIAFQITDDYLDFYGDSETLGKNTGGDVVNNKKSWLTVEAFRKADDSQKKRILEINGMGEDKADEKLSRMGVIYEGLEIKSAAEKAIDEYFKRALKALAPIELDADRLSRMEKYASLITFRDK